MAGVITLTTDFGLAGACVAAMKGVVLSINPRVNLIDICHTIKPRNIRPADFVAPDSGVLSYKEGEVDE